MNKAELVRKIAKEIGVSIKDAQRGLDTTLHIIRETLKKGQTLRLLGFGTFSTNTRGERVARNFNNGKAIKVKAKKVVKFKPGKALADMLAKVK